MLMFVCVRFRYGAGNRCNVFVACMLVHQLSNVGRCLW